MLKRFLIGKLYLTNLDQAILCKGKSKGELRSLNFLMNVKPYEEAAN